VARSNLLKVARSSRGRVCYIVYAAALYVSVFVLVAVAAYKEDLLRISEQRNAIAVTIDLAFTLCLAC
jgi:hypothetical protein